MGDCKSLTVVNTYGEKSSTRSAIVSQFGKYLSIAEVFTNFDVDPRKFLDTTLLSFIVLQAWWKMWMGWVSILTRLFIVTLFKHILYELRIPHNDLLLIFMILSLIFLIHVVSLPPTQPLSQDHLPLLLSFPLFIIHPSIYFDTNFTISSSSPT